MEFITSIPHYAIWAVLVLSVLVFVHEMGHYLAARYCGVRVEVFSIGFGPEIYGWTDSKGTRWKVSAVPVGGYVKMFGERQEHSSADGTVVPLTPAERAVSFAGKTLRQRALIVFAGPAANLIYAVVVMAGLFSLLGQPFTPADVGEVDPRSAADRAGFKPGDVVLRIDDTKIERFEQIQRIVQRSPGVALRVIVLRDGKETALVATPDVAEFKNRFGGMQREGRLGVRRTNADRKLVRYDPATALWQATQETANLSGKIFESVGQMISGSRSLRELGGPLRIMQMSGETARDGPVTWIMFTVILSINLGLFNLFPIPLLDGGHLLFYLVEALRGRPLDERTQEYGFRIGIALILCFALFLTWNDLVSFDVAGLFSDS
jgi:regulator of sigma E protease